MILLYWMFLFFHGVDWLDFMDIWGKFDSFLANSKLILEKICFILFNLFVRRFDCLQKGHQLLSLPSDTFLFSTIHPFVCFFRYISVSSAQLFISDIHLTSSNESETGCGLLLLSAAILFYNVFFVFLEINLANSISLFFFSFATAILLFTVLNAQTPDWVILLCGFRYGPPWLLSLMRDVIPKQDGSGLILYGAYSVLLFLITMLDFNMSVSFYKNKGQNVIQLRVQ